MKILLCYFPFLSWLIFTSNFYYPPLRPFNQSISFVKKFFFMWEWNCWKLSLVFGQTTAFFFFQFFKTPDKYLNDISEKWTFFLLLLKLATKQKAAQIHVCSKHILELLTNKAKQSLVYQSSLLSLKFRVKGTNHYTQWAKIRKIVQ